MRDYGRNLNDDSMLSFLRKIRKSIIDSGSARKYLLYAIGEIALVVIGILIALQINNWNQKRIETKKEIFHLENILSNLQDDLDNQIIPCIKMTERQINAFYLLKSGFYEDNSISNDSIRQLFFHMLGQWDLILTTVAFDNLKSSGMDIVSNDSITTEILTLYSHNYNYINQLQYSYDNRHYDRVTKVLFDTHVDMWDELTNEGKVILRKNVDLYLGMKNEARYSLDKYLRELKKVVPKSEKLIETIKQEIKRLK